LVLSSVLEHLEAEAALAGEQVDDLEVDVLVAREPERRRRKRRRDGRRCVKF
jgi:hypothetical protein